MANNNETVYVIGHKSPDTDSICSAIAYARFLNELGENAIAARSGEINPETEFVLNKFNIQVPELLTDASGKRLVLVDHNEPAQGPDNIDKAEILEVIDHHKIAFKYSEPIYFHTEPVGCTATIIAWEYVKYDIEIATEIAGIMLSAILSDTVVFKSPTTTEDDVETAEMLAEIAEIEDIEAFGIEVKKAKSSLKGMTPEAIIYSDFKDFEFSGKKVGIGQIEVVDMTEVAGRKTELINKLKEITKNKSYILTVLIATDIMNEGSDVIASGETGYIEKAFNKAFKDNSVYLEGVMSRKKDVVPPLEKAFKP